MGPLGLDWLCHTHVLRVSMTRPPDGSLVPLVTRGVVVFTSGVQRRPQLLPLPPPPRPPPSIGKLWGARLDERCRGVPIREPEGVKPSPLLRCEDARCSDLLPPSEVLTPPAPLPRFSPSPAPLLQLTPMRYVAGTRAGEVRGRYVLLVDASGGGPKPRRGVAMRSPD